MVNAILVFEVKEDFIYEKPSENEEYKKGEVIELTYTMFKYMAKDKFLDNFKLVDLKINENYENKDDIKFVD